MRQSLPPDFISSYRQPQVEFLRDLFNGCAVIDYVLPRRPGEEAEVFEYRKKAYCSAFPAKRAVSQSASAIANQSVEVIAVDGEGAPLGDSQQQSLQLLLAWDMPGFLQAVAEKLLVYGSLHLLPLWSDNDPCPLVISPDSVLVEGESVLIWREYLEDVFDLETFETSCLCQVHVLVEGEYSVYRCPVRKVKSATHVSSTYQPEYSFVAEAKGELELFSSQSYDFSRLIRLKSSQGSSLSLTTLVVAYLRTQASLLDVLGSTGYVQRVLTPESQGNLDLPVSLEEIDTSNAHLIKAAKFEFAEMRGTAATALMTALESLEQSQLAEFGLDLSAGQGASGVSRSIDASRFKQLCDATGRVITEGLTHLLQTYLEAAGLSFGVAVLGLTDFSLTSSSQLVTETNEIMAVLAQLPQPLPLPFYRPLILRMLAASYRNELAGAAQFREVWPEELGLSLAEPEVEDNVE